MFLFHQGVYSLPPQPNWFLEFVQRRLGTHGIGVRGKARVIPTTDLARDIWPEAIQQNLPLRPMVLLIQSSMLLACSSGAVRPAPNHSAFAFEEVESGHKSSPSQSRKHMQRVSPRQGLQVGLLPGPREDHRHPGVPNDRRRRSKAPGLERIEVWSIGCCVCVYLLHTCMHECRPTDLHT